MKIWPLAIHISTPVFHCLLSCLNMQQMHLFLRIQCQIHQDCSFEIQLTRLFHRMASHHGSNQKFPSARRSCSEQTLVDQNHSNMNCLLWILIWIIYSCRYFNWITFSCRACSKQKNLRYAGIINSIQDHNRILITRFWNFC